MLFILCFELQLYEAPEETMMQQNFQLMIQNSKTTNDMPHGIKGIDMIYLNRLTDSFDGQRFNNKSYKI